MHFKCVLLLASLLVLKGNASLLNSISTAVPQILSSLAGGSQSVNTIDQAIFNVLNQATEAIQRLLTRATTTNGLLSLLPNAIEKIIVLASAAIDQLGKCVDKTLVTTNQLVQEVLTNLKNFILNPEISLDPINLWVATGVNYTQKIVSLQTDSNYCLRPILSNLTTNLNALLQTLV